MQSQQSREPFSCCPFLHSLVAQRLKHLPATRETWVQSLGREDPMEKEMATYSSILAWKMPWMEELGRLQPMGCFLKWGNLKTLIKKLQMIKQMERYAVLMDWEN